MICLDPSKADFFVGTLYLDVVILNRLRLTTPHDGMGVMFLNLPQLRNGLIVGYKAMTITIDLPGYSLSVRSVCWKRLALRTSKRKRYAAG